MSRSTKWKMAAGLAALLAVVATAIVVVRSDDDSKSPSQASEADDTSPLDMSAADVLDPSRLKLLKSAVANESCPDGAEDVSLEDDHVVVEVMRVENDCLVVDLVGVDPERLDERIAELDAAPGVVAISVTTTPSIDQLEDRRNDQWPLDELGVTKGSDALPWPDGAGSTVAVIDTGIDATHGDLDEAVVNRWDSVKASETGAPLDAVGHGTHVAGIIAARAGNGGVVGVAPGARLLDVPAELHDTSGTVHNRARPWPSGLVWAVNHGADVVNMSFSYPESDFTVNQVGVMLAAIEFARRNDVALVAAVGNCGPARQKACGELSPIRIPAAFAHVIGVGAVDRDLRLAGFSSRNETVDLVAAGDQVWSTLPGGDFGAKPGTSMASPHVAAAFAVLRAVDPTRSNRQLGSAIAGSARKLPEADERFDVGAGYGALDLLAAVKLVEKPNQATTTTTAPPSPVPYLTEVHGPPDCEQLWAELDGIEEPDWLDAGVPGDDIVQVLGFEPGVGLDLRTGSHDGRRFVQVRDHGVVFAGNPPPEIGKRLRLGRAHLYWFRDDPPGSCDFSHGEGTQELVDFTHPTWGQVTLEIYLESYEPPHSASIAVIGGGGEDLFSYDIDFIDELHPLGRGPYEALPDTPDSPIDKLGHIFLEYTSGRSPGVIVLRPVADGIDDVGTLEGLNETSANRFYFANVVDVDGDGIYEIQQNTTDCEPSCAEATTSTILRWNGKDYVP